MKEPSPPVPAAADTPPLAEAPRRVEVPRFPNNAKAAVTLSFDDGVATDRRVVDLLNSWGLKATWNLNSGTLRSPSTPPEDSPYTKLTPGEVAATYAGHEVAIHTVTHPHLARLEPQQMLREVLDDRHALEDLVGYPVRGMAYPFGSYDARVLDVLRPLGLAYARTVLQQDHCFPPADPLVWAATGHQYDPALATKWADWYASQWFNGVFFVWGHTYEFAVSNDWAAVERIYKPLAGKPDVWYCTNVELFDYEEARRRLVVAANRRTAYNPSGLAVTVLVDGRVQVVPPGATVRLA
jgi:peptidoglycan/xylan/chitin deacetylase (PgdA/CDA1 family)